jgi:hypothetical protein
VTLALVWQWLARMGAPIIAAFLLGQYVAGRNCEEAALRADNAKLTAEADFIKRDAKEAETARVASEIKLQALFIDYKDALENAGKSSPSFRACLAEPLPERLRIPVLPG